MIEMSQIEDFYQKYKDSLEPQYQASVNLLDQQRSNAMDSIMGTTNKAGMMYSNFPMREKLKYDQNTYMPALTKTRTAYQTGLDSLRNNAVNLANYTRSIEEAIADLNNYSSKKNSGSSDSISLDDLVSYTNSLLSSS